MSTLPDLEAEMHRLIAQAQAQGIFLRLLGGLAIKVQCPQTIHPALERKYPDIDFVTDKAGAKMLLSFLPEMGYIPNKTFNTLSGDRRQLWYDEAQGRQIDVFIGEFTMCHTLPLADRLDVEPLTIPLAELFLSKAQIVQLNRKDVLDLLALLLYHEVGPGDDSTINSDLIAGLCAKDWGLYTTISLNAAKLRTCLDEGEVALSPDEAQAIKRRIISLQKAMDDAPKTMAWKMRARVGTRVRWYEEVEEVQRT
ncbi:MAG: nucleotidyltransferase family protein [Anaerolineaceae bacterium]|nr:nucleotidyltransferase family protein [Anaerolineaceae bacterium]